MDTSAFRGKAYPYVTSLLMGCSGGSEAVDVAAPVDVAIEPSPAIAAPGPQPEEPPETLLGRWDGIGKQDSGPTWKMELHIFSLGPGECAKIDYPSIPCGGRWDCTHKSDGFLLEATEMITYGKGRCHNAVPVKVKLARDRRSLAFAVAAGSDSAEASLRRVSP